MDLSKIKDKIDREFGKYATRAEILLEKAVTNKMQEWKKRFPKRSLWFIDGMGSVSITVDEKDIYVGYPWNDKRAQELLRPLQELVTWYCEMSDRYHIQINDIKL